jgi:hypothetical protein
MQAASVGDETGLRKGWRVAKLKPVNLGYQPSCRRTSAPLGVFTGLVVGTSNPASPLSDYPTESWPVRREKASGSRVDADAIEASIS